MSRSAEVRAAIVDSLKTITELKSVEVVKSSLVKAELERVSVRSPAALVAYLGFTEMEQQSHGNKYTINARFGIFLLTTGQERVMMSVDLVEKISLHVAANRWGCQKIRLPTNIEAETLFDAAEDRQGMFLMGITFQQKIDIDRVDPSLPGTRADDKTTAGALGQPIDQSTWPETLAAEIEE